MDYVAQAIFDRDSPNKYEGIFNKALHARLPSCITFSPFLDFSYAFTPPSSQIQDPPTSLLIVSFIFQCTVFMATMASITTTVMCTKNLRENPRTAFFLVAVP